MPAEQTPVMTRWLGIIFFALIAKCFMQNINDLEDLLVHFISELYTAEEQVLEAMPVIIQKAQHRSLKNALQHHLDLTAGQKKRLEEMMQLINDKRKGETAKPPASLAAESINEVGAKGVKGLIEEAEFLLSGTLSREVTDSAIIACVQKIEHYEICTYGTAHAFAAQLHLKAVEALLLETLDEEYGADDLLTALATSALNKESAGEESEQQDKQSDDGITGSEAEARESGAKVSINERTVNSPGGRAGTSHRRYPSGESRGH
jgi:ferritin-like metal-binding protein YciE